jgi:hypothetical protein
MFPTYDAPWPLTVSIASITGGTISRVEVDLLKVNREAKSWSVGQPAAGVLGRLATCREIATVPLSSACHGNVK